ncbi:hypothetical protein [Nocardia sp. NPDC056100]|uniref:hypothetical protein n=1 Tax=Nocardia sp. NPDC056100 TaxID=3345712 RepID=UPI0035DA7ABC
MSEIDEIAQETGKTFRDVLNVAGQWLRTLRGADGRAPKLTRKQRRELAETIAAQVGAERVHAAYYTKRVADYRDEHAVARYRRENDPFYTDRDAAADTERLDAMRLRIEEGLGSSALGIERRGQVVMALDRAARQPYRMNPTFDAVFTPMNQREQRDARAAAVESEQWVTGRVQELNRDVASMTVQQPTASTPTPQQDQPNTSAAQPQSHLRQDAAIDRDVAQANAVQDIRHVQYTWLRDQANGRSPDPYGEVARRQAAERAKHAGMTTEEIRREFANAETNSRCQVTLTASSPDGTQQGMRAYFATEADAAAWTRDAVRLNTWAAGTTLAVRAREAGRRNPFYVAEGNQVEIDGSVDGWNREVNPEQAQPPDQERTNEKPTPATSSENLERRVLMLQRGLDAVTSDRDNHKKELDSVRAELETLKNTQLTTNKDMRDLRSELEVARAERDRYRGERDEAVTKIRSERADRDRSTNGGYDRREVPLGGEGWVKPKPSIQRER